MMNMGTGFGAAGVFSMVLLFLAKVLFVLFVIGLVVGIAIAVKRIVFTQEDLQKSKTLFPETKKRHPEKNMTCNRDRNSEWKVCPFCGAEAAVNNA